MVRGWIPTSPPPPMPLKRHRGWIVFLLLAGLVLLYPLPTEENSPMLPAAALQTFTLPSCVQPGVPQGEMQVTATARQLMQGKMLLIDAAHPLPQTYVPGDTFGVLSFTRGQVACRDLAAVSGQETLEALTRLFTDAYRQRKVQLTLFAGTRSAEQQRILLMDTLSAFSRDLPLSSALEAALDAVGEVGCSEHQTAYAVDLRLCPLWNGTPLEEPYEATEEGQWLIENCWRYGFVRRWPEEVPSSHCCKAFHLRYVGQAHAMLMHALRVSLEEYLELLHEYGSLTLLDTNNAPLAAAVCQPVGEQDAQFNLPMGQVDDLSLDNMGYAIASCLLTQSSSTP